MNQNRPINLALSSLKFPPMAIASILHRLSGILIFILLPGAIYLLGHSLHSQENFSQVVMMMNSPFIKLLVWAFLSALTYHLVAGIRHVIMDLGFGESLSAGRNSARLVIFLSIILIISLGIWIW